jgi:two-component system OmpR family response regulator
MIETPSTEPPDRTAARILHVGLGDDTTSSAVTDAAARHGWHVVRAADLESTVGECTQRWPTVGIVELGAPGHLEAEAILRWLRQRGRVPVVSVTGPDDVDGRLLALRLGVDDHAVIPVHPDEIEARLLTLVRRVERAYMRVFGDLVVDRRSRRVIRRGHEITLTPREITLLECVLNVAGEVVRKEDLRDAMGSNNLSLNLVEVHMSSLRRKLERSGPPLIHTVHGIGYVLRPTPFAEDGRRVEFLEARERLLLQREEAVARRDRIVQDLESLYAERRTTTFGPDHDVEGPAPDHDVGNSSGPSSTDPPTS